MRKRNQQVSHERLLQLLSYDPRTGGFTRRVDVIGHNGARRWRAGTIAGHVSHGRYRKVYVDGVRYYAHRLAVFYMTGEWPDQVDHKNGGDNSASNLRACTQSQNLANRGMNKNNTSGYKGVSFDRKKGRYCAYLTVNLRRRFLGYFDAAEDAHAAYRSAAERAFGEFANPGIRP